MRYLDENIGKVIAALKSYGRYENTLIVYMADHGYCLGHHGRFEKHCGYDQALRVPLIFWWPGHVRQGVVTDLTESVDVPHTILDLLDAPGVAGPRMDIRCGHIWRERRRRLAAITFFRSISRTKKLSFAPRPIS